MKGIINILASGVVDDEGEPLANGTVSFFEAGTTTRYTVYQDFDLTEPHANPATLDEAGKLIAYTDDRIKLVFSDSDGAVVETIDNVGTSDSDIVVSFTAEGLAGDGLTASDDGTLAAKVDGVTIEVGADGLQVKDAGIGEDQLANNAVTEDKIEDAAVTTDKLDDDAVTTAKIGDSEVTAAKIEDNPSFHGTHFGGAGGSRDLYPTGNSMNLGNSASRTLMVGYAGTSSGGYRVLSGLISAAGAVSIGQGFSASRTGTGTFSVTLDSADAGSTQTIWVATAYGADRRVQVFSSDSSSAVIKVADSSGTLVNDQFMFFAMVRA